MRIFGTSVPKSGTHFLGGIFSAMGFQAYAARKADGKPLDLSFLDEQPGGSERSYVYGHWRAFPHVVEEVDRIGCRVICLVRDPRDVCLSMADYLLRGSPRATHVKEPLLKSLTKRETVSSLIRGFDLPNYKTESIAKVCRGWKEWEQNGGIVIRYEDIIAGVERKRSIPALAEVGIDPEMFLTFSSKLYRSTSSPTMNVGTAFRWKTEFDDTLRDLWSENARGVAASWGYEED